MKLFDTEGLRCYLADYTATAMGTGLWPNIFTLEDLETMTEEELKAAAEECLLDVDRFVIDTEASAF